MSEEATEAAPGAAVEATEPGTAPEPAMAGKLAAEGEWEPFAAGEFDDLLAEMNAEATRICQGLKDDYARTVVSMGLQKEAGWAVAEVDQ